MNAIRIWAITLLCLLAAIGSNAGKVYTWTDDRGVTHISDTPPPPNAKNRDIIEYVPKSEDEQAAIRQQQQSANEQNQREQIVAEARESRRKAEEARIKAVELKAVADQLFEQSEAFKMKTSNTIRRWQLNKSTRLKLEKEAAEAQARALAADQEASRLETRAQKADKRLKEMLADEERLAAEKSAPAPR